MKERIVRIVAGSMVITAVALALTTSIYWLGLAVFVGLNLVQSALSGFCPLEKILARLGIKGTNGGCGSC